MIEGKVPKEKLTKAAKLADTVALLVIVLFMLSVVILEIVA